MKNFFISISIFILTSLIITTNISAQNTWIGGTPGSEMEWNNPRNWSLNHVPDFMDLTVIIPDVSTQSGFFPVIKNEVPEIGYLNIDGGAMLTITKTGTLFINGESTYNHGIQNTGSVNNGGKLIIKATALSAFANPLHNIKNTGAIALEETEENAVSGVFASNK